MIGANTVKEQAIPIQTQHISSIVNINICNPVVHMTIAPEHQAENSAPQTSWDGGNLHKAQKKLRAQLPKPNCAGFKFLSHYCKCSLGLITASLLFPDPSSVRWKSLQGGNILRNAQVQITWGIQYILITDGYYLEVLSIASYENLWCYRSPD